MHNTSRKSWLMPRIIDAELKARRKRTQRTINRLKTAAAKRKIESLRQFNRNLPIGKFPVEILSIIFQYAIIEDDFAAQWDHKLDRPSAIASVCSLWRTIAMSFPALWTTIDLRRIPLHVAKLYRKRAEHYPITLANCDISCEEQDQNLLFSNALNVRSLSVVMSELDRIPDLLAYLKLLTVHRLTVVPSPQTLILESLECSLYSGRRYSPVVLERPLFGGQTPLLRNVKFANVHMPWRRGFYCNLYKLEIESTIGPRPNQDEDILHVLRDCPHLRVLTLVLEERDPLSTTHTNDHLTLRRAPHHEIIHLPYLQELKLQLPVEHLIHVLRSVDIESVHSLQVRVDETTPMSDALALALPPLFPHKILGHLRRLDVHLSQAGHFHVGHISEFFDSPTKFSFWWRIQLSEREAYNDAMLRRIKQAWGPHTQQLVRQHVRLRSDLTAPGRIPMALYPFSAGLLLPSAYLHVSDNAVTHVCADETITITPEEWPRLRVLELSGCHLDSVTMKDWVQWCRRLTESKCPLQRWILPRKIAELTDEEGQSLKEQIAELDLDVVWRG